MPARLVRPSAASLGFGQQDARPWDLEQHLRKAVIEALGKIGADDAMSCDLLDSLACLACEACEAYEAVCETRGSSAALRQQLRDTVTPVFEEANLEESVAEVVLEALLFAGFGNGSDVVHSCVGVDSDEFHARLRGLVPASHAERSLDVTLPGCALQPLLAPVRRRRPRAEESADVADSADNADCLVVVVPSYSIAKDGGRSVCGDELVQRDDNANASRSKRYRRRGEVERDKALKYLEERDEVIAAERQRLAEHEEMLSRYYTKRASERAAYDEREVTEVSAREAHHEGDESDSSDDEVSRLDRALTKQRLRELGEVATFFGESDNQRLSRLRSVEVCRDQDVLATGSTNVMQLLERRAERFGCTTVERDEEDYVALQPFLSSLPQSGSTAQTSTDGCGTDVLVIGSSDLVLVPQPGTGIAKPISDRGGAVALADDPGEFPWEEEGGRQEREEAAEAETEEEEAKNVSLWLRLALRDWEQSLVERAKDHGTSAEMNIEKANFRQSKQFLRPLRRALRDRTISPAIITSIAGIANHCKRSNYKEAKEAYMRLAIGNQAWPMGITMVTFHDRANRHKISEDSCAHILNDETTRKYVQMVKRLVSFYETFKPTSPSLSA